jgi:hypothetical protein|eukprot:COSAG06_NODE_17_length_34906_cov_31.908268_27_plen_103_part_00
MQKRVSHPGSTTAEAHSQQSPPRTCAALRATAEADRTLGAVESPTLYKKTPLNFECFPYVCPELVLVKCSFLNINGSGKLYISSIKWHCKRRVSQVPEIGAS